MKANSVHQSSRNPLVDPLDINPASPRPRAQTARDTINKLADKPIIDSSEKYYLHGSANRRSQRKFKKMLKENKVPKKPKRDKHPSRSKSKAKTKTKRVKHQAQVTHKGGRSASHSPINERLEEELNECKNAVDKLKKQLNHFNVLYDRKKHKKTRSRSRDGNLKKLLAKREEEVYYLKQKVDDYSTVLLKLRSDNRDLVEEVYGLKTMLQRFTLGIKSRFFELHANYRYYFNDLANSLKSKEIRVVRLLEKLRSLRGCYLERVCELKGRFKIQETNSEDFIGRLREEISSLKNAHGDLKKENGRLKNQNSELQKELTEAKKQFGKDGAQGSKEAKNELGRSEPGNSSSRALKRQMDAAEIQKSLIVVENKKLKNRNEILLDNIENLRKKNAEYLTNYEKMKKKVEEYEKKISEVINKQPVAILCTKEGKEKEFNAQEELKGKLNPIKELESDAQITDQSSSRANNLGVSMTPTDLKDSQLRTIDIFSSSINDLSTIDLKLDMNSKQSQLESNRIGRGTISTVEKPLDESCLLKQMRVDLERLKEEKVLREKEMNETKRQMQSLRRTIERNQQVLTEIIKRSDSTISLNKKAPI